MCPKNPITSANITPTLAKAHGPSFPPIAPRKYPCHDNHDAKVFVTNPHPTIVPISINAIDPLLIDP
jgi:hypothetical protein